MALENMLVPGKTCQRIERADRLRIIFEGRDYFRAVK